MYVMGVARIVWDGEAAITDSNLALTKRKSEEAKFVQETSQGLENKETGVSSGLNNQSQT